MRSVSKKAIWIAALLVPWVFSFQTAEAQAAGNPFVSSHWPSVISYASLNQVAPPTGGDYTFEVTHLDVAHGGDHQVGILTASPNFWYVKYELLETQITTDPDVTNLINYCTNTLHSDPENAFYHYSNNTQVDLSPCGGSASQVILGWGSGTATQRSQARVLSCGGPGTPVRYTWNHGDTTCLQPYMKHRTELDVTTPVVGSAHLRGVFWDEFGAESGCTPSSFCLTGLAPTPSVGGLVAELNNENRATLASDGKYETNMKSLLTAIQTDIQTYTSNDGWTYPNIANINTPSTQNLALTSGGALTEFFDTEGSNFTFGVGEQASWNLADSILSASKIFIWTEADPSTPSDVSYAACDFKSKDSRHRMWALSNYWMVKDLNRYAWYSQNPQNYTKTLDQMWYAAQQYDIGTPSGSRTSIQIGTTAGGYTYNIFRRNYTKGIILVTSRNGYGADATLNYGERVGTPISLGATYHVLNYDGTLGPGINSIQPCYTEAVTLVPDAPPVTHPGMKNVKCKSCKIKMGS